MPGENARPGALTTSRLLIYLAVAAWVAAAAYSAWGIARFGVQEVTTPRPAEVQQRIDTWSPIYGFAASCASRLPAGATVVLLDPTATSAGLAQLPTDRGPAAYGGAADLDWPNAATFEYVTYPHHVTVMGHVPDGWTPSSAGADYVAVWDQATFRSPEARAEAKAAADAVGQSAPAERRCSFSDAAGDVGVMVAAGPRSAPFGSAGTSNAGGLTPASLLLAMAGLVSLWLIGFAVLFVARRLSGPLVIGMALPAGATVVALQMLVYSVVGIRWSLGALGLPWLLVGGAVAVLRRSSFDPTAVRASIVVLARLNSLEWLGVIGLIVWGVLVTVPAPLGLPYSDGFDFYFFKARAFITDGSVIPYYSGAGQYLFSLPAHPPLVPLAVDWLYLFMGQVEEHAALLLWPAIYLSLVIAMYGFLRLQASRAYAIWYTLAFALISTELAKSAAQPSFTDLPLALFLFLAVASIWTWNARDRSEARWMVLGGFFLGAAALTKEEGLVASTVVIAGSLLLPSRRRRDPARWWPSAVAALVWLLIVSPWIYLRLHHALPVETVSLTASARSILGKIPVIAVGMAGRALLHVAPAAVLLLALWGALSINGRPRTRLVSAGGLFLIVVMVGQLAGDALGIATSRVEVHLQLQIAGTRLLSQLLPVFFFSLFWVWVALAAETRWRGWLTRTDEVSTGAVPNPL